MNTERILTEAQVTLLRKRWDDLGGPDVPLTISDGMGVDSTAVLVAFIEAGIRPQAILFADTGGEKDATYRYIAVQNKYLQERQFPEVTVCKLATTTDYDSLQGNCLDNETLPSLAFGLHSCSVKWKIVPQDMVIQGAKGIVNKHPGLDSFKDCWKDGAWFDTGEVKRVKVSKKRLQVGIDADGKPYAEVPIWDWNPGTGRNPIKVIGYDDSDQDRKRRGKVHDGALNRPAGDKPAYKPYDFWYPLQDLGWKRGECIKAIQAAGLEVPVKSACYFCPASKAWELWWLAAVEPHHLISSLEIEYGALTGKHSRWDEIKFGAWESYLDQTGKKFPSKSHCGLGRSFSWCKWAYDNDVVDLDTMTVIIDPAFALAKSKELRKADNAEDVRGCGAVPAADTEDEVPVQVIEVTTLAPPVSAPRPILHLKRKPDVRLDPFKRARKVA